MSSTHQTSHSSYKHSFIVYFWGITELRNLIISIQVNLHVLPYYNCKHAMLQLFSHFFYKHLFNCLIHWVILLFRIFKTLVNTNQKSWLSEILRECSPPHHVSHVRCQVSSVTFFVYKVLELIWGGLVSRGPTPSNLEIRNLWNIEEDSRLNSCKSQICL